MTLQTSINHRNLNGNENEDDDDHRHQRKLEESNEETEEDLIENYRFLTKHCGVLKQSTTSGVLNQIQQQQSKPQPNYLRAYSSVSETTNEKTYDYKHSSTKQQQQQQQQRCSPINDLNSNNFTTIEPPTSTTSRVPPTIYYDDIEGDVHGHNRSFSLVRLFTRMKTRLKHDKRYHPKQSHELLCEADTNEWYELTKNVRTVLTKALLPDGGYDAIIQRSKSYRHQSNHRHRHRPNSYRRSRDYDPVLNRDNENDDDDKIEVDIDDEVNAEDDAEYDEIIWQKFLTCSRGHHYRRCGVCKAVDRQQFQGQLVYFYGVANNILIDENLKASGLG